MGRILMDFRCKACKKETERFIDSETRELPCDCGGLARKIIGIPRIVLEGITGDFPGAHAKWAATRDQNRKVKTKRSYHEEKV